MKRYRPLFILVALLLLSTVLLFACNFPFGNQPTPEQTEEMTQPSVPETEPPPESKEPETGEQPEACAIPAGWVQITSVEGDSYASIASAYQITVVDLLGANCLPVEESLSTASEPLSEPVTLYVPPAMAGEPAECQYPDGWVVYEEAAGESYSALAETYGLAVEELLVANCLPVDEHLAQATDPFPQAASLYVPPMLAEAPEAMVCEIPQGWIQITVKAGESYESIAQMYGVSVDVLLTTNCLPLAEYQAVASEPFDQPVVLWVPAAGVSVVVATPSGYTLKPGEFPYCIARRFNVDPNQLLQANGLSSNSYYYSGTRLKIPKDADSFPGDRSLNTHPATYTVLEGDNIYKIACKYGDVFPEAIVQVNGLSEPYTLTPGQQLTIP
jgi:LysM repeat protein